MDADSLHGFAKGVTCRTRRASKKNMSAKDKTLILESSLYHSVSKFFQSPFYAEIILHQVAK